jgi:FkbM family methyltransferase
LGGDWARSRALTKQSRFLGFTVSRVRNGGRFVTSRWRRLTGRMAKVRVGSYAMRVPEDMLWAFSGGRYYEHNVIVWFDRMLRIESDQVFYDIGANYGYSTLCAASVARQVYSFEPVSETRRQLRGNIDRNDIQEVVMVYPVGLSDSTGAAEVNLYSSRENNSQYPRTSSDSFLELVGTETIELAALDELVEAEGIPLPTIVKMDIEGAELYALRGAHNTLARSQPILFVEFDEEGFVDAGYTGEDILAELDRLGYMVFGLLNDADDSTLYPRSQFAARRVANLLAVAPRFLPKLGDFIAVA